MVWGESGHIRTHQYHKPISMGFASGLTRGQFMSWISWCWKKFMIKALVWDLALSCKNRFEPVPQEVGTWSSRIRSMYHPKICYFLRTNSATNHHTTTTKFKFFDFFNDSCSISTTLAKLWHICGGYWFPLSKLQQNLNETLWSSN